MCVQITNIFFCVMPMNIFDCAANTMRVYLMNYFFTSYVIRVLIINEFSHLRDVYAHN